MATFVLLLVTGQLAAISRLFRSMTSTWLFALLFTYILGLDFSSLIASRVSPSTFISATFFPAVVSNRVRIQQQLHGREQGIICAVKDFQFSGFPVRHV